MNLKRICVLSFSPTGGTEKIARLAAGELAGRLGLEQVFLDFTRPEDRQSEYRFGPDNLLVMASPVYAGRLPNKLMPEYQAKVFGGGTPAVPLCVFGNRSPDEALRELVLLLEGNGFQVVGAAAFAGRHAFSDRVGAGRPDEADLARIAQFAAGVAEKLTGDSLPPLDIDRSEIGPYYTPLKEDGAPAKFLKAKPQTDWDKCVHCGLCARSCPMGSIDRESMEATGLCIKCQACVRGCPTHAKFFTDGDFLSHVAMLEQNYTRRAEHQIVL
ncbi:MAG: 4Fe-4S binding protein [Lawsonibacter sp.]|nr:4Fe-4S binding protein [Lawsonibacter sp.]